jgi:outer membrane lipoprotein LolB
MKIKIFIIVLISCLLEACATLPAPQQPYNQSLNWTARQKQLGKITTWNIKGAVAIRSPQKNFSATMNWKQRRSNYQISLFGPLGIGAVNISGRSGKVTLQTSDKQTFTAKNPETLLQKQLGWTLPVSSLYYWIRGLPVPKIPATKQFDGYSHLVKLQQQGWQIRYLRYSGINHVDLPSKIFLNYPKLSLKIVISSWE